MAFLFRVSTTTAVRMIHIYLQALTQEAVEDNCHPSNTEQIIDFKLTGYFIWTVTNFCHPVCMILLKIYTMMVLMFQIHTTHIWRW